MVNYSCRRSSVGIEFMASRAGWICVSEGAGSSLSRKIPVMARRKLRTDGLTSCSGTGNVMECHLIAIRYVAIPGGASVIAGGKHFYHF